MSGSWSIEEIATITSIWDEELKNSINTTIFVINNTFLVAL